MRNEYWAMKIANYIIDNYVIDNCLTAKDDSLCNMTDIENYITLYLSNYHDEDKWNQTTPLAIFQNFIHWLEINNVTINNSRIEKKKIASRVRFMMYQHYSKCHVCGNDDYDMSDDFGNDPDGKVTYTLFYYCDECGATSEEVYRFDRTDLNFKTDKIDTAKYEGFAKLIKRTKKTLWEVLVNNCHWENTPDWVIAFQISQEEHLYKERLASSSIRDGLTLLQEKVRSDET